MAPQVRRAVLPIALVLASSACINIWSAYEDPQPSGGTGKPQPEPSLSKLAEGMILQTYYVAAGQHDRFAVRRCVHANGLPDRCEVTVVGDRSIVGSVPTYRRGQGEWEQQGNRAKDDVKDLIADQLGKPRVALTRLGIFGARWPDEGVVSARVHDGRVQLLVDHPGAEPEILHEVEAPPGVTVVLESYRSERAPDLFAFTLSGSEAHGDRNNGFVAFRRVGARKYRLVAWLPPIAPNPTR